jgi:hypothetical protein
MRVEYRFELSALETPRFSVEAVEGIGKLFTLATLVLNVLETRREVDLVFHGLNPDDPERKINAFREILEGSPHTPGFEVERGRGGQVRGASSYFQWVTYRRKASAA